MDLYEIVDQVATLADTHRMLSNIYHWFTEGFDTQDLKDAKVLLEQLSARIRTLE